MVVEFYDFKIETEAYCDIIDITSQVQDIIRDSNLKDGLVNVHVAGSTGAISTTEFEPGLVKHDIEEFLEKIIPYNANYKHHETWGDHNGAGHLRSFLMKTSQSFPFKNKKLLLGTWQQIIYLENDEKPRRRKIILTLIGD
ncbi:MAG: YjbQ family protein [Promethearchaeota archaeon]|jgi:secondary thiamine-phosphate synthase enzyme|nr:MAG: YjbQ family protein [Candidatus Lokiarchaeota archaeon]